MEFTTNWFEGVRPVWEALLPRLKPLKVLEIGAFEGRATTWLIAHLSAWGAPEIHCIDTWAGGVEHQQGGAYATDMVHVEQRFHRNVAEAQSQSDSPCEVIVHKMSSDAAMLHLLASGLGEYFDLIYVDGSHQASDVLSDAVLGFKLLKVGGMIIFDDYAWIGDPRGVVDHYEIPKPAIDAFVNLYRRKLSLILAPCLQVYVQKTAS